jgi:hypothetical protein
MSSRRKAVVMVLFHGGLAVLMTLILTGLLQDVMPTALATRVGYNSEGYLAALLLVPWLQFARPRLVGRRAGWFVAVAVGVASAVVGVLLVESDLPSRFRTLNETFLGLAVVIPYLQARRPIRIAVAIGASAATLLAVIVFNHSLTVTRYAEGWMLLVLIPLAFDVADRGILAPEATTSRRVRYTSYALLAAFPVAASLLYHADAFTSGFAGEWIRYEVRVHESFVATLLTVLYFAVGLGRIGRGTRPVRVHDDVPAAAHAG